jgi:hypothetical protein
MSTKLLFLAASILVSFIGYSQTKKVKCPPNNEVVMVPKKPQKTYEAYTKKTDLTLKAAIDVLKKIEVKDLDAGVKREVVQLREKLDQYSGRTQDIIKASFMAFCTTPCDLTVRKKHFELLESISKESSAVEQLRIDAEKILSAGNIAGIDDAQLRKVLTTYKNNEIPVFENK